MTIPLAQGASREPQQFAYIDALRGIAILGVVAVHSSQTVPAGSPVLQGMMTAGLRGVQLFYIASAVTLCLSWHSRHRTEARPVRNFFVRRWFRIAPLFLLAIVVYLAIYGFGPRYWAPNGVRPWFVPATALLLHGFHPETINAIVPGGWSIAVEVTFYAVLPWLLPRLTCPTRLLACLLAAILAYVLDRVLLSRFVGGFYPADQQYLVDTFTKLNFLGQAPVFAIGLVTYEVIQRRPGAGPLAVVAATVAGVIAAATGLLGSRLAYVLVSDPVVAAVGMSWFVATLSRWPVRAVVNRLTTFLGRISYGLYLCHWLVIEALRKGGFVESLPPGNASALAFFCLTMTGGAALAWLLYHAVERPGIRLGSDVIRRWEDAAAASDG
jgi:peptidoglycan/LPS O-acetylase OafA/YrhL